MRTNINDDDTKRGLEAEYWRDDDTHCVYIQPTNCRPDWVSNFIGTWPRKYGYHRAWHDDACWLIKWLAQHTDGGDYRIFGYSRGGAIAMIVADYLSRTGHTVIVVTFGAPKPGRLRHTFPLVQYRHRGDIVPRLPILYRKPGKRTRFGDFKPFWKAHQSYKLIMQTEGAK